MDNINTMPNPNLGREKEPLTPKQEIPQTKIKPEGHSILTTVIIAIATLLIGAGAAGAGIYYWQNFKFASEKSQLEIDLQEAQSTIAMSQEELTSNTELLEKLQENPPIPDISIIKTVGSYNESKGSFPTSFTIKDGENTIYELNIEIENEAGVDLQIFKQTAENVYFYSGPLYFGEKTHYPGMTKQTLYKYNLRDKSFTTIFEPAGSVEDLSTDENLLAYKWENNIFVLNIETGEKTQFSVPENYTEFGDITFSPNGKHLVFAAIEFIDFGIDSALFHIDIENNTMDLFSAGDNRVFHIKELNSNNYEDTNRYYIPIPKTI